VLSLPSLTRQYLPSTCTNDAMKTFNNLATQGSHLGRVRRAAYGQKQLSRMRLLLCLGIFALVTSSVTAQLQQAWVAKYNNGITNGTNQAVRMALDSGGNIYVTGFSQNALSNLGYVTIKYAPNGNQIWATRFDSTIYPIASPTSRGGPLFLDHG